jgi:hypothetical protein
MNHSERRDTMSGKKKTGEVAETTAQINEQGDVVYDSDETDHPNLEAETDTDSDDDFDFDLSLLGVPEGIKLVDLAPDFVRPEGFLMVPRLNKKTGEISPMTTTFAGILHDVIPWKDNRGKERLWFAFEATVGTGAQYTGRDEKNKEFKKPVQKGDRIGISGSGAINALKGKRGHFVLLHWTGNKITVKNGDMWEVKAKVSDKPIIELKE